jgi:hypothetical protein
VADDPGASPTPPEKPSPDGGVITTTVEQLEGIVEKIVDKLLGDPETPAESGKPQADPEKPKTDRETETDLRGQVANAVSELERERQHVKEHADLKAKIPQPPEAEVLPWRKKLWGGE